MIIIIFSPETLRINAGFLFIDKQLINQIEPLIPGIRADARKYKDFLLAQKMNRAVYVITSLCKDFDVLSQFNRITKIRPNVMKKADETWEKFGITVPNEEYELAENNVIFDGYTSQHDNCLNAMLQIVKKVMDPLFRKNMNFEETMEVLPKEMTYIDPVLADEVSDATVKNMLLDSKKMMANVCANRLNAPCQYSER